MVFYTRYAQNPKKKKHTCIFQTISTSLSIFPGYKLKFKLSVAIG